mgnify:CR=1 FL=1
MGNLTKQLAKNLKRLRASQTQVEFAKKLGISKSSLNRLEIGEQNISIKTIERICDRLKIPVEKLLG